jgi:flavin-dependent dehydrogenase
MIACDVLIAGGGPAGSSCARALTRAGLHVIVLDKATFPRDKTCAGWITPPVLQTLAIDADDYRRGAAGREASPAAGGADRRNGGSSGGPSGAANDGSSGESNDGANGGSGRTLQPIRAFRTSRIGEPDILTTFDRVVSYGIRRCEFDHYLLQRSGADVRAGEALTSLRREHDLRALDGAHAGNAARGHGDRPRWIVNETIAAPLVIGAGGHFCPIARQLGGASLAEEPIVAAQEIEVTLSAAQAEACRIAADTPELFLTRDLKGYGWCFRKERVLNVGLGRQDRRDLARHVRDFVATLIASGKVPADLAWRWKGHAYLIHGTSRRRLLDDGMLLIGDAAGFAYPRSGEGIRPAIESGLLAAQTVIDARGGYRRGDLEPYRARILARFGTGETPAAWRPLPDSISIAIAGRLLAMPWFARQVFLTRWFLHAHEPALVA